MNKLPLIYVVEDDSSLLASTLALLKAVGFAARGYASTGEFLLDPPPPEQHGCILLDVRLPGPSGLDLQAGMLRYGIALPVIFVSSYADVQTIVQAMKGGAVDFLEKPAAREALLGSIRRALEFDAARRLKRDDARQRSVRLAMLTKREREVFDRIVAGKLNKQIASELGLALRTVKAYRAQLMIKLDVKSPAELGRLAVDPANASEQTASSAVAPGSK